MLSRTKALAPGNYRLRGTVQNYSLDFSLKSDKLKKENFEGCFFFFFSKLVEIEDPGQQIECVIQNWVLR